MKLPTDDEQEQGRRRASNRIAHPCFPCHFLEIGKYQTMITPSGKIDISGEIWNQCQLNEKESDIKKRCIGYYHSDIKKDVEDESIE